MKVLLFLIFIITCIPVFQTVLNKGTTIENFPSKFIETIRTDSDLIWLTLLPTLKFSTDVVAELNGILHKNITIEPLLNNIDSYKAYKRSLKEDVQQEISSSLDSFINFLLFYEKFIFGIQFYVVQAFLRSMGLLVLVLSDPFIQELICMQLVFRWSGLAVHFMFSYALGYRFGSYKTAYWWVSSYLEPLFEIGFIEMFYKGMLTLTTLRFLLIIIGLPHYLNMDIYYVAPVLLGASIIWAVVHIKRTITYRIVLEANIDVKLRTDGAGNTIGSMLKARLGESFLSGSFDVYPILLNYYRDAREFRPLFGLKARTRLGYFSFFVFLLPLMIICSLIDTIYYGLFWMIFYFSIYPVIKNKKIAPEKWAAMTNSAGLDYVIVKGDVMYLNRGYWFLIIRYIALCFGWRGDRPDSVTTSIFSLWWLDLKNSFPGIPVNPRIGYQLPEYYFDNYDERNLRENPTNLDRLHVVKTYYTAEGRKRSNTDRSDNHIFAFIPRNMASKPSKEVYLTAYNIYKDVLKSLYIEETDYRPQVFVPETKITILKDKDEPRVLNELPKQEKKIETAKEFFARVTKEKKVKLKTKHTCICKMDDSFDWDVFYPIVEGYDQYKKKIYVIEDANVTDLVYYFELDKDNTIVKQRNLKISDIPDNAQYAQDVPETYIEFFDEHGPVEIDLDFDQIIFDPAILTLEIEETSKGFVDYSLIADDRHSLFTIGVTRCKQIEKLLTMMTYHTDGSSKFFRGTLNVRADSALFLDDQRIKFGEIKDECDSDLDDTDDDSSSEEGNRRDSYDTPSSYEGEDSSTDMTDEEISKSWVINGNNPTIYEERPRRVQVKEKALWFPKYDLSIIDNYKQVHRQEDLNTLIAQVIDGLEPYYRTYFIDLCQVSKQIRNVLYGGFVFNRTNIGYQYFMYGLKSELDRFIAPFVVNERHQLFRHCSPVSILYWIQRSGQTNRDIEGLANQFLQKNTQQVMKIINMPANFLLPRVVITSMRGKLPSSDYVKSIYPYIMARSPVFAAELASSLAKYKGEDYVKMFVFYIDHNLLYLKKLFTDDEIRNLMAGLHLSEGTEKFTYILEVSDIIAFRDSFKENVLSILDRIKKNFRQIPQEKQNRLSIIDARVSQDLAGDDDYIELESFNEYIAEPDHRVVVDKGLSYNNLQTIKISKPKDSLQKTSGLKIVGLQSTYRSKPTSIFCDELVKAQIHQIWTSVNVQEYVVSNPNYDLVTESLMKYKEKEVSVSPLTEMYGDVSFMEWALPIMNDVYGYKNGYQIQFRDIKDITIDELKPNVRKAFPGMKMRHNGFMSKEDRFEQQIQLAEEFHKLIEDTNSIDHDWALILVPKASKRDKKEVRAILAPESYFYYTHMIYMEDFIRHRQTSKISQNFELFFGGFDRITRMLSEKDMRETIDTAQMGGSIRCDWKDFFIKFMSQFMSKGRTAIFTLLMNNIFKSKIFIPYEFGGEIVEKEQGWSDGPLGTVDFDTFVAFGYWLMNVFLNCKRDNMHLPNVDKILQDTRHFICGDNVNVSYDSTVSYYETRRENYRTFGQNLKDLVRSSNLTDHELMGFKTLYSLEYATYVGYRSTEKIVKSLIYRKNRYREERENQYFKAILDCLYVTDCWNKTAFDIINYFRARLLHVFALADEERLQEIQLMIAAHGPQDPQKTYWVDGKKY